MDTAVHSLLSAEGQAISNPAILGGKPVFAGTRVPVAALFDYLADKLSLDYFLETFPTVGRKQQSRYCDTASGGSLTPF